MEQDRPLADLRRELLSLLDEWARSVLTDQRLSSATDQAA
jgi:hypothetical protein